MEEWDDWSYDVLDYDQINSTYDELEISEEIILEKLYVKYPLYIFLLLTYLIGIVGNFMVVLIVFRKKSMRSSLNAFLCAVAIADVFSCFSIMITGPIHELFGVPVFNKTLCHVVYYFHQLGELLTPLMFAASLITLTFFKETHMRFIVTVILIISIFAVIFGIPRGYFTTLYVDMENDVFCIADWPNRTADQFYQFIRWIVEGSGFFLSLVLCIIKRKSFNTESSSKKITALVAFSIVFWLPHFLTKVFEFHYMFSMNIFVIIMIFIFITNSFLFSFKPILYFVCDESFSREFKSFTPCCFKKISIENYVLYNNETA